MYRYSIHGMVQISSGSWAALTKKGKSFHYKVLYSEIYKLPARGDEQPTTHSSETYWFL